MKEIWAYGVNCRNEMNVEGNQFLAHYAQKHLLYYYLAVNQKKSGLVKTGGRGGNHLIKFIQLCESYWN